MAKKLRNIKTNKDKTACIKGELRQEKFSPVQVLKLLKKTGFVEIRSEKPGIRTFLFPESYKRLYIKCINNGDSEIREGFRFSKSRAVNL